MPKKQKKLTQADVLKLTEQWATLTKKISKLESEHATERSPIVARHEKQLEPIAAKYDRLIDPLQTKADDIETQILEWLDGQKKSTKVESKSAIAEFIKGSKLGDRVVNAETFVRKCVERKIKDFWKLVTVTIKSAETVMGKDDMAEICDRPKVAFQESSLTLK